MLEQVTFQEIQRIFEITDRMGIHREALVIPLAPRRPGAVRKTPKGKLEIVVDADADADFELWLSGLEEQIRAVWS